MTAMIFWLSYLLLAFVIAPIIFRARHERWPYAYPLHRADAYLVIDLVYGVVTIGFTAYVIVRSMRSAVPSSGASAQIAGVLMGTFVIALGAWAVMSLGPSWRIGQDRQAKDVSKVTTGPYRIVRHPIYHCLIMLSIAMMLMAGVTIGTVAFAAATLSYALIQGWNENRHWHQVSS